MALTNAFSNLALDTSVQNIKTALDNKVTVVPDNVTGKFRDSFETFTNGVNWNLTTASGDIVQLDGNTAAATYLVISKDPLTANGITTSLDMISSYLMPIETAVGLSLSQRNVGQELSLELVSTETPISTPAELTISSISQTTTTLTVTTTTNHNLVPGMRIGIYGVPDSRLNYPSLVVAGLNSLTQFTCTAGPMSTIPSVTSSTFNTGFVYIRSTLGGAPNGMSEIFENATATSASAYTRANAGDALATGTLSGNHSITVATTASNQAITGSQYTYAFLPSSEYRFNLKPDSIQVSDVATDSTSQSSNRYFRTQVCPDPTKNYKLRFRFVNNKGLSIPTAKIVSVTKTGTTTATVTTDIPHGLTTTDYIVIYGNRDQTNFANLTTATAVASTPTSTTFTIAYGAAATATTYGGMVSRIQGGNIPTGYNVIAIQSAANDGTELTLVGNTNWTWVQGDYINVYGCRNSTNGADLGVDGAYKVAFVSTTTMRLLPIGSTTLPATFATTNAGGTTIKRTDARIGFARLFQYARAKIEMSYNPIAAGSLPTVVNGGTIGLNAGSNLVGAFIPNNTNTYTLLTSTNLTASSTYTGSSTQASASSTSQTLYPVAIAVSVQHTAGLTPGTLVYEVGSETSSTAPTTWYPQFTVPIPSNASWTNFILPLTARYYRLRFINGATAQTSFRLATTTYYNGPLAADLTYPNYILYPLSTTALAASGAFTGPTLDFGEVNQVYRQLKATAFADQASGSNGFTIQVSRDGTTWRTSAQASVTANTLTTISADLVYRYARVVYTNGATLQGSFALDALAVV